MIQYPDKEDKMIRTAECVIMEAMNEDKQA